MGRLKKETPPEVLAERQRGYSKTYYWKNKERIDARVRENYRSKAHSKTREINNSDIHNN